MLGWVFVALGGLVVFVASAAQGEDGVGGDVLGGILFMGGALGALVTGLWQEREEIARLMRSWFG